MRALEAIRASVRNEMKSPSDESLVRIAAAHTELKQLPASASAVDRAECFLDIALTFNLLGQTVLGIEPATRGVEVARLAADQSLLARALLVQGNLFSDSGILPAAIECYAGALDLSLREGDVKSQAKVWNNLGAALLYAAQYEEASQAFTRSLELGAGDFPRTFRAAALSNIALACLHTERFEEGIRYAEAAAGEIEDPVGLEELHGRVNTESHLTILLLEAGRPQDAWARCRIGRAFADASHSLRADLTMSLAEGLAEVYSGSKDVGVAKLEGALQKARVSKYSLRDALLALVKASNFAGEPQRALVHLRELLRITRNTQQQQAIEEHRMHLRTLATA